MNLVDSSGWVEFFADGPNAGRFARPILDKDALLVPTICLYEVFKIVSTRRDRAAAFQAIAHMNQGRIIDIDAATALQAARISMDQQLPMADSLIYAVAGAHGATLWTQDVDFEGLPGVQYVSKSG